MGGLAAGAGTPHPPVPGEILGAAQHPQSTGTGSAEAVLCAGTIPTGVNPTVVVRQVGLG